MLKNGFLKYVVVQLAKEEYPPITEGLQKFIFFKQEAIDGDCTPKTLKISSKKLLSCIFLFMTGVTWYI